MALCTNRVGLILISERMTSPCMDNCWFGSFRATSPHLLPSCGEGWKSLSTKVLVGVYLNHVHALKVPVENTWMHGLVRLARIGPGNWYCKLNVTKVSYPIPTAKLSCAYSLKLYGVRWLINQSNYKVSAHLVGPVWKICGAIILPVSTLCMYVTFFRIVPQVLNLQLSHCHDSNETEALWRYLTRHLVFLLHNMYVDSCTITAPVSGSESWYCERYAMYYNPAPTKHVPLLQYLFIVFILLFPGFSPFITCSIKNPGRLDGFFMWCMPWLTLVGSTDN